MQILKQSTAVDVLIGPFLDLTDASTAETGESPSVKLSKNGQGLATKNEGTTPASDADGYYNCIFDATDTNTVGTMVLTVAATANALPVRHEYQVVEENVYDAWYGSSGAAGTDLGAIKTETDKLTFTVANQLDTNPLSWAGGTIPAQGVTGVPEVDVTHHTAGIAPAPATTGVPHVNTVEFLNTAVVLSNGLPDINVEDWLGTLVAAATAGVPNVNTTTFLNVAVTAATASGEIAANVTEWLANAVTHGTGGPDVNINAVSDDTVAAATLELFVEKMDQSTGQIDSGSFAAGAINAAAIATDAITAAKIAANAITSSEIADGAITVAKITALDSAAWANAQNFFDATGWVGGTIKLTADMTKISGGATAADNLQASAQVLITGLAETGTLSTAEMTTNLASSTDDFYIGRTVIWTSGVLLGQASDITDYTGTGGKLQYSLVTNAPGNGDSFVIV